MRLVFVLFLLAGNLIAVGQQRPPMGRPNQFTQGWNRFGYLQSDSGLIIAERDTTFKPRYGATVVYRRGDRKFYYYDSVYAAWYPLASDTTGSVNDKFNNLTALTSAAVNFPVNSILSTKGFYNPNDGGAATYIISTDTIAGLPVDSVSQIKISNGLYCVLYHLGVIRWEQFGAKGDSVTNDMPYFDKCMNYARHDRSVNTILGMSAKTYRLSKLALYPGDWELGCFIRVDFGDILFDFQGAKVVYDNNSTQSYVYMTDANGITGLYRCKSTNSGHRPTKVLYWSEVYWQIMKDSVVDDGLYPMWDSLSIYYGGQDFAHIGYPFNYGNIIYNITWKNLDISGNEKDSVAQLDGYWNINTKAFYDLEKVKNERWYNVKMHNIASEVVYGGGTNDIAGFDVENCEIYVSHNAVSHGGGMRVHKSTIHDCPANAIESYPAYHKQDYTENIIYNCKNGITTGGAGTDINDLADVTISRNRIYNCLSYGVFIVRRARGVSVTDNSIYDCVDGNVSMYTLSDLYPDAVSDIRIEGNFIGVYKKNISSGIVMSCANAADSMRNSNIFITGNIFGRLEQSYIEHLNKAMAAAVSITGYQYKALVVANNSIIGGCNKLIDYTITYGYTPVMYNNYFNRGYSGTYIASLFGADNDYSTAITFPYESVKENNTTFAVSSSFSTLFIKSPSIGLLVQPDYDRVNFITDNTQRTVILPGTQDNLKRALYMYGNPSSYCPQQLTLVKSNDAYADGAGGALRYSWKYELNRVDSVNTTYVYRQNLTGSLEPGDSVTIQYGQLPFRSDGGYDQLVFDSTVANNLAFNSSFQITPAFNVLFIDFKIKNISGSTQSLSGNNISVRYYPLSVPTKIPTYLQPLRKEGKTNMRPSGDDLPNGFIYWDTQLWKYFKWDGQYQTWVDAETANITKGLVPPSTTPFKVGDMYIDMSAKKLYFATGTTSSSDWTIAN